MGADVAAAIQKFSVWVIPLVIAITMHEAAHGLAAAKLGDNTARMLGRVTLNPVRHIDPIGTLALPGMLLLTGAPFLFGWAKPVPVNFFNLRPLRAGMILVALAGPGTNLALALISALALHAAPFMPGLFDSWYQANLVNSVTINLVLAVFNMLPLPPLDGGRVLVGLLPYPLARRLARVERFTFVILIAGLFLLPMIGWDPFYYLIEIPVNLLMRGVYGAAGLT